jgi:ferredoxin
MLVFKNCGKFRTLQLSVRCLNGKEQFHNEDYGRKRRMKIDKAELIYFSPTGTTKSILAAIAEGLGAGRVEHLDLTPAGTDAGELKEISGELVIIGTPVYSGRVPLSAAKRLQRLKTRGGAAVVVVVYGNRAYEDALLELKNIVAEAGFTPVAAAAFVGEHSFASETMPIANGRPDTEDLRKAKAFGRSIREKMERKGTHVKPRSLEVPGNFPYKERVRPSRVTPVTRKGACTACGTCVEFCPVAAITLQNDSVVSDGNMCILCCACVKDCPEGARVVEDATAREKMEKLSVNCRERKEPEIYLL